MLARIMEPGADNDTITNAFYRCSSPVLSSIQSELPYCSVHYDPKTNRLVTITNLASRVSSNLQHNLVQYWSADGADGQQASGAYAFRPYQASLADPVCASLELLFIVSGQSLRIRLQ